MIRRLRLRPGRRRVLCALTALSLACAPLAVAASPTVGDVVAALRADDDARARALLDTLRAQGLGGVYDVRFLQGVLHLRAGEGAEAARVFDDLEASEGPAPALASGQALSAWAAGRHAEARTRLEHAVRLWPEDPGVWANLGDVYRALAAHAYQRVRALRRNPDAEAHPPLAPALSVQPPTPPSSGAPAPATSVPTVVPAKPSGSAAPARLAAPAAPTPAPTKPEPDAPIAAPAKSDVPTEAPAPDRPAAQTAVPARPIAPAVVTVEPAAPTGARTGTAVPTAVPAEPDAPAAPIGARAGSTVPTAVPAEPDAPAVPTEAPARPPAAPAAPAGIRIGSAVPLVPVDPAASSPPPSPVSTPESLPPASPFPLPSPGNVLSVPEPSPPEAPAGSVECFLAGPWPDVPPAEVLEWLQVHNAQVMSFQSRSSRYRVYLGPFEDRERAMQAMVSMKKDLGVDDVAWIPSGPLRDAVSLGVYLKRESVDRRLRALHALGLDPKVQPPLAGSSLRGSTTDLRTLLTDWSRAFPEVSLTPERCPPSP